MDGKEVARHLYRLPKKPQKRRNAEEGESPAQTSSGRAGKGKTPQRRATKESVPVLPKHLQGRSDRRKCLARRRRRRKQAQKRPQPDDTERVPFDSSAGFHELRRRAIAAGARYGEPYESLLSLLETCEPLRHRSEEERGASYKRLAKAAYMAGLSGRERKNLYWIAERVGLSDRFAGHLIACLKRGGGSGRE